MRFKRKHLLGLEELKAEEISLILDTAENFKEVSERAIKKVPALRGITVANLFYEPSTRTKLSFELAEKRLSADSVSFSKSTSSVKKGESLRDTAENIEAMKVDIVVMRHGSSGAHKFLTEFLDASVVNAGDGQHEHPTQALLDMLTLKQRWGSFEGKKVTIIGDIKHSRVARSNIWGLTKMGVEVTLCGPPTMMPVDAHRMGEGGVRVEYDLRKAVAEADAVNILRIQLERQESKLFPSRREYLGMFGITEEVLRNAPGECIVMHPGPMNRGVEISQEVADGERAVILPQVTNGVAVRMAVLFLIAGGKSSEAEIN
ncbi:MAG: aspartate carbamoyltransferase catalytic subunit [Candidatus Latescibacteria bacterium]|nr:aspartate carbamoyltransferase catalytic subunit [bacterium]MBD3424141.1 aspartate carbamoyltransferase catalytic subunit [Candidatus Latescibacterota bacterium]